MVIFKLFTDGLRLVFGDVSKGTPRALSAKSRDQLTKEPPYFTANDVLILQKSLQQLKGLSGIYSECAKAFNDQKLSSRIFPSMSSLAEDTPEHTKHFIFQYLKFAGECKNISDRQNLLGERPDADLYKIIPKINELFSFAFKMAPAYLGLANEIHADKLSSQVNSAIQAGQETEIELKELLAKRDSIRLPKSLLSNKHHSDFDLVI
jgi:hypothetical protein